MERTTPNGKELPWIPDNCTDLDTLTGLFCEFCAATGLPEMSASEIIAEAGLYNEEYAWLSAFIECWEAGESESAAPIQTRHMLAHAYIALIGYDPFEDSPGITADEVARTLSEFLAEPGAAGSSDPKAVNLARRAIDNFHKAKGEG